MDARQKNLDRSPVCLPGARVGLPGAIVRQDKAASTVSDQADILGVADGNVEERRDARPNHNGIEFRRTFDHECKSTESH